MAYLTFSALFAVSHIVSYTVAGMIDYPLVKRFHGGEGSLYGAFMRDMSDPKEAARSGLLILPVQALRGLLMSVVLYPVIGPLGEMHAAVQFAFLGGLMFVYADFASAVPFSNTIEGLVYMKPDIPRAAFWRTTLEAVIYSASMGAAGALFLF